MTKSKKVTAARASRNRNRPRKEWQVLLGLGLVVLVFFAAAVAFQRGTQAPTTVNEDALVRADSPVLGPPDAQVTIVEFLDPECESCRASYPAVKEILQQYDGQVRLVVRYFPLHNNSVLAAIATEAAGEQGQYWEMHELLFERQPEWGEQSTSQRDLFVQYARQLGLDEARFLTALENPDYTQKVERDRQDGVALGVTGTPTFFVDGRQIEPLSYDALVAAIEAGLSASP